MAVMKGIKVCGECANYDWKKHKCKIGCYDDSDAQAPFYGDCPLPDVVPKSEVAREIFEEIEKKVKSSLTIHLEEINKEHIKDTPLYDRHSGIIFALKGMDDFITELKKKYTEGE